MASEQGLVQNAIPGDRPGPRKVGAVDDAIIEMWLNRQNASQLLREPYEPQWTANWKAYRAFVEEHNDPQDWWRSNVFIPEMFNAVETLLPRSVLGQFSKPEWFDINCMHSGFQGHSGQGMNCQQYEMSIKSLLLGGAQRMDLFEPSYMGQKYGTILGHSWYKVRWERKIENRVEDIPVNDPETGELLGMSSELQPHIAYDDPKLDWISNFRLWPDPTGNNDWFIEEIETTFEKLESVNRQFGGKLYKNMGMLALMSTGKDGTGGRPRRPEDRNEGQGGVNSFASEEELTSTEGFSKSITSESFDGPTVKLLICSGRVSYEPGDGVRWRRQIIANDHILIRDAILPTPDLKPEYFGVPQIPIPGFVYGDSVVRYSAPLNDQLNRIENFRMDEVILGVWQQYVANRGAVTDNSMLFQPGGVVWVDTAQDVQSAFRVLDRKPLLPQAYTEAAVKRDQIERTTAATAAQQGSGSGDRETATSFQGRVALGNERFRLATMWQNFKFKRELLKRMFGLYQRNLPPGRIVRLLGTDQALAMDITMLQDDIDIMINADVSAGENAAKQQALSMFLQSAVNPQLAQWFKMENLLPDVVSAFIEKDSRKYVRTAEEMSAIQQAEMFTAALGGATPGANQPAPSGAGGAGSGSPTPVPRVPTG